MHQAANNIP